ncbi:MULTISPECIES: spore coat protein U domain-containing protein [Gammaproteobacteria]|uniref:spore coat protein U domain-containing protein n=1 Tax=Gammaproteobacteria TaxID=1236 RepID=UPI001ADCB762|nr:MULTISPECIES: spore coat protein U domain-containing protein [Gammaproteobacteria]MBO9482119.1 spore coat protein U domain-containing protein [Salinisphaera sp. G21_0]MBO9494651.1 spore coat protein U domain-containing protein [Thalassotalea sp. G20_0]
MYLCTKSATTNLCYLMFLLLSLSLPSQGAFRFLGSNAANIEIPLDWEDSQFEVPVNVTLQSCFGDRFDGTFFRGCDFFQFEQTYNLRGSDFTFLHQETNQITEDIVIGQVKYKQGSNDEINVNNDFSAGLTPGQYQAVDGTLTFTIFNNALESTLPGLYISNYSLFGQETSGFISASDDVDLLFKIRIPDRVRISGLKDIEMTAEGNQAITSEPMSFCVFSQGGTDFKLKATGKNDANQQFYLSQGGTPVNYKIMLQPALQPGIKQSLSPGVFIEDLAGSDSQDCYRYTANNVQIFIDIPGNQTLATGVYSDTVTLTVIPE